MRKTILLLFASSLLMFTAAAQPVYVTQSSSGTSTSVTFFATSPQQQARIVQAVASSDLATANLTFKTGVTPLTIAYTNPAAAGQLGVSRTNGFTVGDFIIVETAAGVITNAQITGFGAATNITVANKVMATVPGDQIYLLSAATTLWVGNFTNRVFGSEAVFVGGRGRPVQVMVNGTSACSLDAVTARYE